MSFNQIFDVAGSALNAQTVRLNTISSNLANANSASSNPDDVFKPLKPVFLAQSSVNQNNLQNVSSVKVVIADVIQSNSLMEKRYEPDNPLAGDDGFVYHSGINPVNEMADMMSASRAFEMNVEVLSSAKSMQQALTKVLEV